MTTRRVRSATELVEALGVLERAEAAAGVPLVDEAERVRVERAVAAGRGPDDDHRVLLATTTAGCTGYAGMALAPADRHAIGDVAVTDGGDACAGVLAALLVELDRLAEQHAAHGTQVWLRRARAEDVVVATAAGYAVSRRLAVLGRSLADVVPAAPVSDEDGDHGGTDAHGITVRHARESDADAIVAVLDDAYHGAPDGGWTRARYDEVSQRPWFRHLDVLIAEDADGPLGVHWTKLRGEGVGEVHNLAVGTRGRGHGLGRRLLDEGLRHLAAQGCHDALLWVDLANEAAVRLYVTAGFTARWEDVAVLRHVRGAGPHDHGDHHGADVHG